VTREKRIGILGGTFDPIHLGHLDAAQKAIEACALDEIVILPARQPPHRSTQPLASIHHRLAMAVSVSQSHNNFSTSTIESDSPTPSFTSLTLRRIEELGHCRQNIFFITGIDAFLEIKTWHNYPAVIDQSHFIVISRNGQSVLSLRKTFPDLVQRMRKPLETPPTDCSPLSIWLVDGPTRSISSSEIRRKLKIGETIEGLVPSTVESYITNYNLYKD
tara:strand:- start:540 stop:1193 length:654 start_codon:yes stop_codon:yes gene_type:complete